MLKVLLSPSQPTFCVSFIASRERLRSIVMSVCVCLSVREDISGTTRAIFTTIFVHVAYVRGSVLLRHVDDRPHRLSAGRGSRECTVQAKCNLRLPCVNLNITCSRSPILTLSCDLYCVYSFTVSPLVVLAVALLLRPL